MDARIRERDSSLDLVRIAATLCVLSVHFFYQGGFYDQPVIGKKMYIMCSIRSFFMCCVPLFLILTGYLMNHKTLSKKYYKGILGTLATYVLCSIVTVLVVKLRGGSITVRKAILDLFAYHDAPYSWYINMYIGLFLIIPFLNIIYHGLQSKTHKYILIFSAMMLTSFPLITNAFSMDSAGWWKTAFTQRGYQVILPDFWLHGYPIMYFFIGAYLSEYKPQFKTKNLIVLLIIHVFLVGNFFFFSSNRSYFARGPWEDWGSPFNVITAVCVFLIITNIKTEKWMIGIKQALKYLSGLCLGIYLLSWIFDSRFYPILMEKIPNMPDRIYYSIPIVLSVFVSSAVLSAAVDAVRRAVFWVLGKIKHAATCARP